MHCSSAGAHSLRNFTASCGSVLSLFVLNLSDWVEKQVNETTSDGTAIPFHLCNFIPIRLFHICSSYFQNGHQSDNVLQNRRIMEPLTLSRQISVRPHSSCERTSKNKWFTDSEPSPQTWQLMSIFIPLDFIPSATGNTSDKIFERKTLILG